MSLFRVSLFSSALLLSAGLAGACAFAADAMPNHAGNMAHGMHAGQAASPSSRAFEASDKQMMDAMGAAYTGDADQDFVSHMLPHHEGAVRMARIQLQYGKDPELRKLAQDVVDAQDREIAFMKAWQAKHPVK